MTTTFVGQLITKKTHLDWAVGLFRTKDDLKRIVGSVVATMPINQNYLITGILKNHPRYGDQLEVTSALPYVEPTRKALQKHLSKSFKGIGARTAEQITDHFEQMNQGLQILQKIVVLRPWDLPAVLDKLKLRTHRQIQFDDVDGEGAQARLYRLLATHHIGIDIPPSVLRRLAKWLLKNLEDDPSPVAKALEQFRKDPYKPMLYVWGYGFKHADEVGKNLNFPVNAPARIAALVYYVLKTSVESEGHIFLPRAVLKERIRRVDPKVPFDLAITCANQRGFPITVENECCYPDNLNDLEDTVASIVSSMLQKSTALRPFADQEAIFNEVRQAEEKIRGGLPLDSSQRSAVLGLLQATCRLHTLTAGPGYGKTSIMEVFAQLVIGSIAFCAPTGKAAKVLDARVKRYGFAATTIHQLLEPSPQGFLRNQENPLDVDVVVVDESSMIDLALFADLLLALKPSAHLILVGDGDQLPSVGPGNILANVLELPADHHQLSTPHRNSGDILKLVQEVRAGKFVSRGISLADDVHETGDVFHWSSVSVDPTTFSLVESVYLDAVKQVGIEQTVLLVARRKGKRDQPGWNTTYLNGRLQSLLNPNGVPIPGTHCQLGDRVIIRRNQAIPQEKEIAMVVNGDTGKISMANYDKDGKTIESVVLDLDDGRRVVVPADLLDFLNLAYAQTVHSTQGSEYRTVIVAMTNGSVSFIHRKVLYTAVSRARERLIIFGEHATLAAIANRPGGIRYSRLKEKVGTAALHPSCPSDRSQTNV